MARIICQVQAHGNVSNDQALALQQQAHALRESLEGAGMDCKWAIEVKLYAEPAAAPVPPVALMEQVPAE